MNFSQQFCSFFPCKWTSFFHANEPLTTVLFICPCKLISCDNSVNFSMQMNLSRQFCPLVHINELLTPILFTFHVNEPLTKDHPTCKTTFPGSWAQSFMGFCCMPPSCSYLWRWHPGLTHPCREGQGWTRSGDRLWPSRVPPRWCSPHCCLSHPRGREHLTKQNMQ